MELEARDLLTVEQAAQYLQVSQSSIRSYIRQGRLQAYRIAGKRKVLIPRPALMALLEPARPEDVENDTGEDEDDDSPAPRNGSDA
jgi:excisionase family DNA binding protein